MKNKSEEKLQDSFKGIISDINEINLSLGKGMMADNFNGRVAKIGENRYAWQSDKGTQIAFSIPPKTGSQVAAKRAKAKVFIFDDRAFTDYKEDPLRQKRLASTTCDYVSILVIQPYNTEFTSIQPVLPLEIKVNLKVLYGVNAEVTEKQCWFSYRFGPSGSFLSLSGTPYTTLQNLYERFATYYNSIISNAPAGHGLLGSTCAFLQTGQELCAEITLNTTNNIVISAKKGDVGETATVWPEYKAGFGLGSYYKNLGYPNAPEYAIPGTDKEINPFSEDAPFGVTHELRENKKYYVYQGSVAYKKTSGLAVYNEGQSFQLDIVSDLDSTIRPYIKFSQDAIVVECSPIGFAYGITSQRYQAGYSTKTTPWKNVGIFDIDKNRALMVFAIGSEWTMFGMLDTRGSKVLFTKLFETDENLDINDTCWLRGFSKYDDDNNLKVYWTSGIGHIRTLNINNYPTSNFDFNTRLIKPCLFGNPQVSNVLKSGGSLLVGSYQFCFELSIDGFVWTRASQHTNPVMIGQSYFGAEGLVGGDTKTATYPKPNNTMEPALRGAPPGTKTTEAIEFSVTNIDTRYNYIKVFSIESISGSSAKVVNVIYNGKLTQAEKYRFSCIHAGARSVVEGNLNLSEVTLRKKVPINVNWISQIENRLIIANYTEDYKLRSILPTITPVLIKVAQGIGCDTSPNALESPSGHKDWKMHTSFKSFRKNNKSAYAWVFIDEYGNESEPTTPFIFNQDYKNFRVAEWESSIIHPHGNADYDRYYLVDGGTAAEAYAKATQENIWVNNKNTYNASYRVTGGFRLFSFGTNLMVPGNPWPTWAKKAILVRQKKALAKEAVIAEGFGIMDINGNIKLGFIPELDGYNQFDNYSWKQGDSIRITGSAKPIAKKNGYYKDSMMYNFLANMAYLSKDYVYSIKSLNQVSYPPSNEPAHVSPEEAMPIETINCRGYAIEIDITPADRAEILAVPNANGFNGTESAYYVFIRFQIERQENGIYVEEDIEEYENTGFEIDLKTRYNNEYRRAFFGDCFVSTVHQMITMRHNTFVDTYLDGTGTATENNYCPVVVWPLITKFNMAFADDSMFPFFRMNPVITIYTGSGFKQTNRDYSVQNDSLIYKFISEAFLKPRNKFKNVFNWSNARAIGEIYDSYADLSAVNQIEVESDFGDITSVFSDGNMLIVVQQYGTRAFALDGKEFVQSSTGTKIFTSAGGFVNPDGSSISESYGSLFSAVQGENGIYFISSQTGQLCLIQKGVIRPISTEQGFQAILDPYLIQNKKSFQEFNGLRLFIDNEEKILYGYIVSRKEIENNALTITDNGTEIHIDNAIAVPEANQWYFYVYEVFGVRIAKYFFVDSAARVSSNVVLGYTKSLQIAAVENLALNRIISSSIRTPLLFGFNETEGLLELRSSNYRVWQGIKNIAIDCFGGNQINVVDENSDQFVGQIEKQHNLIMAGSVWNKLFKSLTDVIIEENTGASNYITNFRLNLTSVINNRKQHLLVTNKEYLFVEGYTYTIEFQIGFPSGGGISNSNGLFFGPIFEILKENATCLTGTFESNFYPTKANPVKYSFKVNKSFVAPMTLYSENFNPTNNGLLMSLSITKFGVYSQFEAYPELYVTNENSKIISLDNVIVTGNDHVQPNRVEVYSKEQKSTLVVSSPGTYGKLRLRQFQMAFPKLTTKERLRSTFFKIKFVYTSNGLKKLITGIQNFYRQ